jgi:hypothetical protein
MATQYGKYEVKMGEDWHPVKGTTQGMKAGWLHWEDNDGCTGLSRPGTWRERATADRVGGQTK